MSAPINHSEWIRAALGQCSCCCRECLVVYRIMQDAQFCSPACEARYADIFNRGMKSEAWIREHPTTSKESEKVTCDA